MAFRDKEKKRAYERQWYARQTEEKKKHIIKIKADRKKRIGKKLYEFTIKQRCSCCGYSNPKNPAALQFHHRNPNEKIDAVSEMVRNGYSWSRIQEELTKCDILCANCHAEQTAQQLGWYDFGD